MPPQARRLLDFFLHYHELMRHQLLRTRVPASILTIALCVGLAGAQTRIVAPDNNYTPAQDVQLGREAAQEAERQLPVLRDDGVTSYVEQVGERLVDAIPSEFRHPEFRYSFKVVNVREINAFALPGGPMYLNRGMIEAARTEGEMASVMAHELSHVALRHGTAQASKATKYQIGQVAGAILGAIIGGNVGTVVAQGTQFGLGAAFLRFSREYERQADLLGSQMMARAGYDPREMANMFKTIEKQGGSGGPEWLQSHPNPSNRQAAIEKEAQSLRVTNPIRNSEGFQEVQARLKRMPRAPTTEQAIRDSERRGSTGTAGRSDRNADATLGRVEPPSTRYTQYEEGGIFTVSVPSNWRELQDNDSVTFAPAGGYGDYNGQSVFTHGVQIGIARNEADDLQTATAELIDAFSQGNPDMRRTSGYQRTQVDGHQALVTTLSNVNSATRDTEMIQLVTAALGNGDLFFTIGVAPRGSFNSYRTVFNRVVGSIRIND
jgi:beta-barrel assembly-enhancing protease